MGSDEGRSDEKPVHPVTISQPFYLGKYEVTQGQWEAVMGTTVAEQRDKATYPIYYVFIRRLNAQEDGGDCSR